MFETWTVEPMDHIDVVNLHNVEQWQAAVEANYVEPEHYE